jgi:hypothetical protein
VSASKRPPLVTTVGVIGIIAGVLPLTEIIAVLVSSRFAAWFLPLVRSMLPVSPSVALALLGGIIVADIGFGVGVMARNASRSSE